MSLPADALPLVSCIMPTYNRRQFVPRAIDYFRRQDYPNKELIVVDDGPEAVADLVPSDPGFHYVRLPRRATIGAKRNLACARSGGSLIAHWDDDDWHAPRRLRCQVESLLKSGADVCGLTTLLFFDVRNGRAWRYVYPAGQRRWLSGNSLMYTRAFWEGHAFPDIDVGEDSRFVWSADPGRLDALADPTIHVGIIHDRNASPKQTGGAWWQPHPVEEIRRLLGEDWGRYQEEAPTAAPPAPAAPAAEVMEIKEVSEAVEATPTFVPPPAAAPPIRNVFACLVHENPDCVADLVRNLRHLDPSSLVLLYNGGPDPGLLAGYPFEQWGAVLHPSPRPMRWGRLHDFAIDCMRFAAERGEFDALTIVDSDQVALRPGYSRRLAEHLSARSAAGVRLGMLGNSAGVQTADTTVPPAKVAHAEAGLWRPFLRRFPGGEAKFVHWSFWPSTVFTAAAARDLVRIFTEDEQLRQILRSSRIWATEEVLLPTLVALLGYAVEASPWSYDFVKYRVPYSVKQLDAAMGRPDVFWAHPVPRRYDDPLRRHVRETYNEYPSPAAAPLAPPLLLTRPILARMRPIEGWLDEDEADLLIAATARALADAPDARAVVEVGSYCGRATVVLASVVRALRPSAKVWSIDPHDGVLGSADRVVRVVPSLEKLRRNLSAAGVAAQVEIVRGRSADVAWEAPIALLLIDGLHDYASVAGDFHHFEPLLADGGYAVFHDYADYFPGVVAFVDQLLQSGRYTRGPLTGTLIAIRKRCGESAAEGGLDGI